jgi:DNA-directed RNA polymerase specialized sigma24 family protein
MELLSRTEPEEWEIVNEWYPPLRRFAAVAAPFDLEPDDLLQEALVAVMRRHRLTELDHPIAYIRKTILNEAAAHSRRMGRRRIALRRYAASSSAAAMPGYPSDLADLYRLSPRERAALYLHEVEGYRFSEIASMLGCSEMAAKKAGSRARRRLAVQLSTGGTT